jgi:hypothetical protein
MSKADLDAIMAPERLTAPHYSAIPAKPPGKG